MRLAELRARSTLLLDLDGVVWAGADVLPGVPDAISRLRRAGRRVAFLTNNSARRPVSLRTKLERFGIPAEDREVMTSGYGTALHLAREPQDGGRGYFVVGSSELAGMLTDEGLRVVPAAEAGAVVVGLDLGFTYEKLAEALGAATGGARLVACNRDRTYPADGGRLLPGCGPLVAALEWAAGRPADLVVGKPSPLILRGLASRLGVSLDDCAMVGDSLETDIAMAATAGIPAAWIAPESHAAATPPGVVRFQDLPELVDELLG